MTATRFLIGVDIGGTKIKAGAVALDAAGALTHAVIASRQIPTPRVDPAAFYDAVAALIVAVRDEASAAGAAALPWIAVAQPGRFLAGGTLARGTAPNLGTSPNQFDGLNPGHELQRRLGGSVVAENDAVAQMRFGLHALLHDAEARPALLGQTVVYLGPGTGMGGGVARVSTAGAVSIHTDGQLFNLQVPGIGDGTRIAEELFNGPAIARLVVDANHRLTVPIAPATAEQVGQLLDDREALPEHQTVARRIADGQGDVLAALIVTIHTGRIVKVRPEADRRGRLIRHVDEPDQAWPEADKALVRGAARFVLGGSVGINRVLGGHIRARALEQLHQRGLDEICIFQSPVASADAGLLGVLHAIPAAALQKVSDTSRL